MLALAVCSFGALGTSAADTDPPPHAQEKVRNYYRYVWDQFKSWTPDIREGLIEDFPPSLQVFYDVLLMLLMVLLMLLAALLMVPVMVLVIALLRLLALEACRC